MGRRRFKKRNGSSNLGASSASSNDWQKKGKPAKFSGKDYRLLKQYLKEYRAMVIRIFNGKIARQGGIISGSKEPIIIGGCTFPMLTQEILEQPYLALPKMLTNKQRRETHQLCVETNLYHSGVADMVDGLRFIAISVYGDGLHHVPGITLATTSFRKFKPWFYQRSLDEQSLNSDLASKIGQEKIYKGVDQPGTCLRDGIDILDFEAMEGEDLSNVSTPNLDTDTSWMLVDSLEKMQQCILELENSNLTELAFDLESHNVSKSQITCLFQLATSDGKEYVIDTLAPKVWEGVGGLAPIFADPNIVKIGHGIGSLDVRSLHRDFGIFVVNAFDTYEAAIVLNLPGKGLAKVCTHYGLTSSEAYVQLKASYQACDWTQRPLEDPQILYGRYDIHYLIQLRRLMMRDLAKYECWGEEEEVRLVGSTIASILKSFDKDERHEDYDISGFITPSNSSIAGEGEELKDSIIEGDDPKMDRKVETLNRVRRSLFGAKELRMVSDLMRVIDKSQRNCLKLWTGGTESHLNDSSFQSMVIRSKKSEKQDEWTPSKLVLYERLARWREEMAKEEKCCAGFICPLSFLVLVALKQPTSKTGLRQLSFQLPEFFENESANDLFQLVVESRLADGKKENADCDIPLYQEYITRKIQGFSGLEVSAEYSSSSSSSSSSITRGSTVVCLSLVVAIGAIVLSRGIRK